LTFPPFITRFHFRPLGKQSAKRKIEANEQASKGVIRFSNRLKAKHLLIMLRFLISFLRRTDPVVPLGRWGYHFEKQLIYQKYYD